MTSPSKSYYTTKDTVVLLGTLFIGGTLVPMLFGIYFKIVWSFFLFGWKLI